MMAETEPFYSEAVEILCKHRDAIPAHLSREEIEGARIALMTLANPPDGLAPIEARGAVTVQRKAYETVCAALGHISVGGINDPRDYASRALHQAAELEAEFLRARESAPAVEGGITLDHPVIKFLLGEGSLDGYEFGTWPSTHGQYWWREHLRYALSTPPSVATGCAGEVTEDSTELAALRRVYEAARHYFRNEMDTATVCIANMDKLRNAIEDVKLVDGGYWEDVAALSQPTGEK